MPLVFAGTPESDLALRRAVVAKFHVPKQLGWRMSEIVRGCGNSSATGRDGMDTASFEVGGQVAGNDPRKVRRTKFHGANCSGMNKARWSERLLPA